jgi:threonine synthase
VSKYFYKCFSCSKEFSSAKIEGGFHYLCPNCGKAEKNKPLKGVLTVEYDYSKLKKELSRNDFLKIIPGKFWLYPNLWPINIQNLNNVQLSKLTLSSNDQLNKLALPANQLLKFNVNNRNFWILDDTRNPTLSYKDRATSVVVLKAMEMGIDKIAAASTGNAGSSLAGICARLGLIATIYVPQNIPEEKRIQIEACGAELKIVEGDYDKAFDLCLEDSKKNN